MGPDMRDFLSMVTPRGKAHLYSRIFLGMRGTGLRVNTMVKAHLFRLMGTSMKATGSTVSIMV